MKKKLDEKETKSVSGGHPKAVRVEAGLAKRKAEFDVAVDPKAKVAKSGAPAPAARAKVICKNCSKMVSVNITTINDFICPHCGAHNVNGKVVD